MYDFEYSSTIYEFASVVTFANGKRSEFKKKDQILFNRDDTEKDKFVVTMLGSHDETIDGNPVDDFNQIILQFGKALYPIKMKVSDHGEIEHLLDFSEMKERWKLRREELIEYYEYEYLVKKQSHRYAVGLKSEEKFFGILKENMLYRLFFWYDNKQPQDLILHDFPARARKAIFTFDGKTSIEKKEKEEKGIIYDTYEVHDEGSKKILSGHAQLTIQFSEDGLPDRIMLWARVEEKDVGYFTKEVVIKRL
ncbi:MAG: hypothetical protein IK017_12940 [Paludibacteraceae bacterium]|nr:hypothetical protein [Paludibacteraceae bacterium]MBR5973540.1 hypothetical protein [Paludibacteraceae bacterium]